MAAALKTEAIVLRALRYGEADRILHLYTPDRGRVSAIAKGARRPKSRFGGRLEPFMRLALVVHEGRSELVTVTAAETIAAYPRLREHGEAIDIAARACDATARLFGEGEPSQDVYNLLANALALLDADAGAHAHAGFALAFRLKLLVAAGLTPELSVCARCGRDDELVAFSGAAGGVVCAGCASGAFEFGQAAHTLLTDALVAPLARAPRSDDQSTLRVAGRAITETAEHHAHVRLRQAVAPT